jgi:hypothetical protein
MCPASISEHMSHHNCCALTFMWLLCFEIHIDARVLCSVQGLIKFTSGRVGQEKKK